MAADSSSHSKPFQLAHGLFIFVLPVGVVDVFPSSWSRIVLIKVLRASKIFSRAFTFIKYSPKVLIATVIGPLKLLISLLLIRSPSP